MTESETKSGRATSCDRGRRRIGEHKEKISEICVSFIKFQFVFTEIKIP